MMTWDPKRAVRRCERGYALVLIMFFLAVITIAATVVAPNIITNGQRDREEEMIWRGQQYARGVKLYVRYYQTHGGGVRFPTSMDDLTKPKTGIRFMRQAYKDPMNTVDGSWRLIYVGPNGQIIGSLKDRSLAGNNAQSVGGFGSPVGSSGGFAGNNPSQSSFGSSSFGGSSGGNSSFGASSFGNSSSSSNSSFGGSSFGGSSFGNSGANNGTNGEVNSSSTPEGIDPNAANGDALSTPHDIATAEPTTIIGGNIIGVGSKINKKSIIWFEKAKNYRQFEFIWDPSKEPVLGGAAPGAIPPNGGLFPNQNGASPGSSTGSSFGTSGSSFGTSGSSFGNQGQGSGAGQPSSPSNPTQGSGQNPTQP
jgi:hypothetical protein